MSVGSAMATVTLEPSEMMIKKFQALAEPHKNYSECIAKKPKLTYSQAKSVIDAKRKGYHLRLKDWQTNDGGQTWHYLGQDGKSAWRQVKDNQKINQQMQNHLLNQQNDHSKDYYKSTERYGLPRRSSYDGLEVTYHNKKKRKRSKYAKLVYNFYWLMNKIDIPMTYWESKIYFPFLLSIFSISSILFLIKEWLML